MDSFEGNQEEPLTLHRYAYALLDPVNGIDPSGNFTVIEKVTESEIEMDLRSRDAKASASVMQRGISVRDWNQAVGAFQGSVSGSAVYKGAAATVLGMVIAGNLAMLWDAVDPMPDERAQASRVLKASVEEAAREKGCGGKLLFYYRDAPRVAKAYSTRTLTGSGGVPSQGFPEGGYASDIPPWDDTYTQYELAEGFFGKANKSESVQFFVAFCDDGTWNPLPVTITPGILHWHKYGKKGQPVPITPVCAGVNGMRD